VIAPRLIPKAPGDKARDRPARLPAAGPVAPAGELVAIRLLTVAEEAVRDLCRARADMLADRSRARLGLGGFLLRHGRSTWTYAHERWLVGQRFDDPALAITYAHYGATVQARDAALEAIEADLATWYDRPPFADAVARLSAHRGVTRLGALTLASEVGDWRRFAGAPQFMGFCGLVPSEYSSGSSTWRGRSPSAATATCARSWSSRPGPTSTDPRPPWSSAAARLACHPRPSPGPGPPSCGCAAASAACMPANNPDRWW
jgi:transposase